jgi:hypothetical protein
MGFAQGLRRVAHRQLKEARLMRQFRPVQSFSHQLYKFRASSKAKARTWDPDSRPEKETDTRFT